MNDYMDVTPEPGKWYVSEGFKAGNTYGEGVNSDLAAHNKGRSKMILAGPFDTEDEAKVACQSFNDHHSPFVWGAGPPT